MNEKLILRCTQKLLTELKQKPTEPDPDGNQLWSWHANVFLIERRKCVLITNDITRYAIFIPSLRKQYLESFHLIFGQHIFKNMMHENFSQQQIEAVLSQAENIQYAKSNNRSVLGTMIEQRHIIEYSIASEGGLAEIDVYKLNHDLNRIVSSAIGYKYPVEMFKEKLEELTLQQH